MRGYQEQVQSRRTVVTARHLPKSLTDVVIGSFLHDALLLVCEAEVELCACKNRREDEISDEGKVFIVLQTHLYPGSVTLDTR